MKTKSRKILSLLLALVLILPFMTINARAEGEETTRKFVTYSLSIDGDKKTVTSITDRAESIPEEFKKLNVKLTKVDDPSVVYEGNNVEWRGGIGSYVVKNFDADDGIPLGDYKVEISWPNQENSEYIIGKGQSAIQDGQTLSVVKEMGNLFVYLEKKATEPEVTEPEVEKISVTHGIYIDGKRQEVQNGKTPEGSLPEELRNLNVKLTKIDDSSIVYEGTLGPWRGNEGYPVVKNFDIKGIPTGDYKIEISGLDTENSKYKIVKGEENPLIDGEILTVTKNIGNQFVHFITSDIVPQEPGEYKPIVPENYVEVKFLPGENGTIADTETTIYWVNPEAGKTLADVTKPEVTANDGFKFTGWDTEDTTAITEELTVTAQYEEKDNEKYEPETTPIEKEHGVPTTEDEVIG